MIPLCSRREPWSVPELLSGLLHRHGRFLVLLTLVGFLTTLPFLTRLPFYWDSAQFELGVNNYTMLKHQPHPPGYPLYIAAGKLLSLVLTPHRSLQAVTVFFSLWAIAALYGLTWQLWRKRWLALVISFGFLLNPLFWFFRETALTYPIGAWAGIMTAFWGCLGLRYSSGFFYGSAITLAVAGGFRPSESVFLVPLMLMPILLRREWRHVLGTLVVTGLLSLIWFVPMVYLNGGLIEYMEVVRSHVAGARITVQQAYGESGNADLGELLRLGKSLVVSLNVVLLPIVASLGLLLWRRGRWAVDARFLLLAGSAWVLPALLFFCLIHFGVTGYLLIFVPFFYLLCAPALLSFQQPRRPLLMTTGAVLICALWLIHGFVFVGLKPSQSESGTGRLAALAKEMPLLFTVNRTVLAAHDRKIDFYRRVALRYEPERTIIIGGTNIASPMNGRAWMLPHSEDCRTVGVVLPNYRVFHVPISEKDPAFLTYQWDSFLFPEEIPIPPGIETVFFAIDAIPRDCRNDGLDIRSEELDGTSYLVGIPAANSFTYCGHRFRPGPPPR